MREIEAEVGRPIGTGYAHDKVTIAFLENWIKEKGCLPPYTRRSWATAKRAYSAGEDDEIDGLGRVRRWRRRQVLDDVVAQFNAKVSCDDSLRKELTGIKKKVQIDLGPEKYYFVLENCKVEGVCERLHRQSGHHHHFRRGDGPAAPLPGDEDHEGVGIEEDQGERLAGRHHATAKILLSVSVQTFI